MSYLWSFASYQPESLVTLLGPRPSLSQERALAMLQWDGSGLEDPAVATTLAKHLSSVGLTYDGLPPSLHRALDEAVHILFSPEGLENEVQLQYESPDGVHPSVFKALLARGQSAGLAPQLLPIFAKGGRRAGPHPPEGPPCEYCLLQPDEVPVLLREVEAALANADETTQEFVPELVQEDLIEVFQQIAAKHLAAVGLLS